ncbi:putative late blight resistance protein homolog R1B-16 [Primulina huaijiensis]|uniref:putative late blight resistance protein homolog R1B-16 n=1 Tax=Primulina huaijiensis TaxID=1492673 RepID=UPI003CC795F4
MTFAALGSLCHITDQILDFDLCFFPFTKEKIESFQETIVSLTKFLGNCPPICSQRVQDLITEIRDASYEAEDILESHIATHFLRIDGSDSYQRLKRFPEYSFEQIKERLESISIEVRKIQLDGKNDVQKLRISARAGSLRSASVQNNSNKVALDKDMELRLMEQLVGGCSKICVIPIVGMAGIGKTTIARILYDSQLIKETFHVRGWSVVSQLYDIQDIVIDILKVFGTPLHGGKNVEQHLYQSLWGRKYLIVLDDVWDIQAWDDIKRLFPDDNNGSRIILTTRDSNVASYANSLDTYHEMQILNDDMSWNLLRQEIFLQKNCPPELVEIGKEIASQCQGLPLALSAIGGHLKKEQKTEEYWKYVSENISSVLKTTNDPSLEILTLSYNYLPHYLKGCFLYLGTFQEDCAISVFTLVRLWVAEGFVDPWSDSMEEAAEEYLYEVIERNLVMVNAIDSFAMPKSVCIHDLFRDICIREAEKEKFFCILNKDIPLDLMEIYTQRRLVFAPNIEEDDGSACSSIFPRNDSCSAIRSFFSHGEQNFSSAIEPSFGLLKVLKVSTKSLKFPVEILELVNLKYLELDQVLEIPSSICRLRNLQTLIALCEDDQSLPSEIWEMPQLRHLFACGFRMPDIHDVQGKGKNAYILKSLQTLAGILDFRYTQDVLSRIPHLKWLCLFSTMPFHSSNSLVYLCKLESLHCFFEDVPTENILPNFFFPSSLKKLVLIGSQIAWEQLTIIGILPNLEVLK